MNRADTKMLTVIHTRLHFCILFHKGTDQTRRLGIVQYLHSHVGRWFIAIIAIYVSSSYVITVTTQVKIATWTSDPCLPRRWIMARLMRLSPNGAARTRFGHLCWERSGYCLYVFLIPAVLLQNLCFIVCAFSRESKHSGCLLPSRGNSGNGKGGWASSPPGPHTVCQRDTGENRAQLHGQLPFRAAR